MPANCDCSHSPSATHVGLLQGSDAGSPTILENYAISLGKIRLRQVPEMNIVVYLYLFAYEPI